MNNEYTLIWWLVTVGGMILGSLIASAIIKSMKQRTDDF